jgi:5-methylcytosine-specific restriction endonuclease McrA
MPIVTQEAKDNKKKYDLKRYHAIKHTKEFVDARRAREKFVRKLNRDKRVFRRLSVYQTKKNGANIKPIDLWRMCRRQKCICPITGRKLTNENMSVDHIKPMVHGGGKDLSNIRLTTKDANLAKQCLSDSELLSLARDIVKTLG